MRVVVVVAVVGWWWWWCGMALMVVVVVWEGVGTAFAHAHECERACYHRGAGGADRAEQAERAW